LTRHEADSDVELGEFMRKVVVALSVLIIGSFLAAPPVSAGVNDVKRLASKFSKAGYDCEVKPAVANFREANCLKGNRRVHMVAFSSKTAYGQWLPLWCDLGTGEPFVSNRRNWIVDSTDVPIRDLRKIVRGKVIDIC